MEMPEPSWGSHRTGWPGKAVGPGELGLGARQRWAPGLALALTLALTRRGSLRLIWLILASVSPSVTWGTHVAWLG